MTKYNTYTQVQQSWYRNLETPLEFDEVEPNANYGLVETFERDPCAGTLDWLRHKRIGKNDGKLSPTRKSAAVGAEVKSFPWIISGP